MKIFVILAIGLLFAGCGSSSDEDTVGKEIADDYNEAMDKARAVEEEMQEHKDEIDKAVDDAMDEVEEEVEKQENP
jgi:precorrin-2 methylase